MADSNKPKKPYPEFPLFPHATKRWAKKIRGKLHYFGPWRDPDGALEKYLQQKDALHAGRTPRSVDGLSLLDLCNNFLTAKMSLLDSGELSAQMFARYFRACERVQARFGKNRFVDDITIVEFNELRSILTKDKSPVTVRNDVRDIRSIFKYAHDAGLIDEPVRMGPNFKQPSKSVLRKERTRHGPRMFEPSELLAILEAANPAMKAMVLLGVNCGYGNTDVASLPQSAIVDGWVDFPRPKTGVGRRCPLWDETSKAISEAIAIRPKPKNKADENLCFVTIQGNRWTRVSPGKKDPTKFSKVDSVGQRFGKLLKSLDINGRHRLGFYSLRRCFETIAGESTDQVAVDAIMGHADQSMAAVYREKISDQRFQNVVNVVHRWLFQSVHAQI